MASDTPSVKSEQALTPNTQYASLVTTNHSQALHLYVTTNTTKRSCMSAPTPLAPHKRSASTAYLPMHAKRPSNLGR
jgi:hypothetical protein